MNAMVFNMEKKRVAQTIKEMPRDDYALIDAQKMMDVSDAANALRLMLDGKYGHWSLMMHHALKLNNNHFGNPTRIVGCGRGGVEVQRPFRSLQVSEGRDRAATTCRATNQGLAATRRRHPQRCAQCAKQHYFWRSTIATIKIAH